MGDISKLNVGGTLYDIKDAKARTDVSDLKEDFTHIVEEPGSKINNDLLYGASLVSGVYLDATGVFDSSRTDYVAVKSPVDVRGANEIVFWYDGDTNLMMHYVFFDEDMEYISYMSNNYALNKLSYKIALPNNCAYIAISGQYQYQVAIDPKDYVFTLYKEYHGAYSDALAINNDLVGLSYWTNNIYFFGVGNRQYSGNRIGLSNMFVAPCDMKVYCDDGYKICVGSFSSDVESVATETGVSGWVNVSELKKGVHYLINFKRSDEADIVPEYGDINTKIRFRHDNDKWDGLTNYLRSKFVHHMTHSGNGTYVPDNRRDAIVRPLMFEFPITVSVASGYKFCIQHYDGYATGQSHLTYAGSWVSGTNNGSEIITAGTYFCMIVANDDDSDLANPIQSNLTFSGNPNVSDVYYRLMPVFDKYREEEEEPTDYLVNTGFAKVPIKMSYVGLMSGYQSFCKYNDKYYSTNGSNLYVQDSDFTLESTTALSLGHANSFQLGNNGLAYVSGWNDGKVYVVDLENKSIVDTITLPTLSGYTTCAVDDVNKLIYIFNGSSASSSSAVYYDFVVYDYDNDTIVSTKKLTRAFGAMQSCDFVNGKIFALNGLGSNSVPNGYVIYNTSGDIISEYILGTFSTNEPEGLFVDRENFDVYISFVDSKTYKVKVL